MPGEAQAKRVYITTPIYYVNDVPHLGNGYTTIIGDALRRYHQLRGHDVRLLVGTDEHGLKLEREAQEQGLTPQAFVDQMSVRFREAWPKLLVEPDDFIRTTEARHESLVRDIWQRVAANGDLKKGHYEDWYCVGCESFKTEKELLEGNICALHKKPVERLKEETYFFALDQYQDKLLDLYAKSPSFVEPDSRRNEVLSFVSSGLKPLSVSRTSFSWGIPVPSDPKHVMYVWFDALSNYWTALGGWDSELTKRFWPSDPHALPTKSDDPMVIHLVGKDILRFHAVFWPAFLMSAQMPLPSKVYAHGFLTVDGQKMSKSLRNAVDPLRLARELPGGASTLRYHLLRAISFGQDGDFDHAALLERYNADLGKNLGNLLSRVLGLCVKNTGNTAPAFEQAKRTDLDNAFLKDVQLSLAAAREHWDAIEPHRALEATWAASSRANLYVDQAAPWAEAKKGDLARVETILTTLVKVLEHLSAFIAPALPDKANEMRAQLGLQPLAPALNRDLLAIDFSDAPARPLGTATPLFPTLDAAGVAALLDSLVPKAEPAMNESTQPEKPPAAALPSGAPLSEPIAYDQFAATDLRIGIVLEAEKVPKKDKLLKLKVDVGEASPRQIVAGLALSFAPEGLVGKRVIVVANLAPRDFGKGLVSHGMLLAAGESNSLSLATVSDDVAPGTKVK